MLICYELFYLELKFIVQQKPRSKYKQRVLLAPVIADESLKNFVAELRTNGVVVKQDITNSNNVDIVMRNNEWIIKD